MIDDYKINFEKKIRNHLARYYMDTLGIKDFDRRYKYRLTEEETEEVRLINLLKKIDYFNKKDDIKMLVVGSGWGGMIYAAKKLGIDVVGLDIDEDEIEISKLRFLKDGLEPCKIVCCPAENMPFEDKSFDLVYSFSVIEHVQDVEKVVSGISRVTKKDGIVYFQVPNYNIPWEGHYKMIIPTFLGKSISKIFVSLRGRNSSFIDTLNFIRKNKFMKLLQEKNIPEMEEWNIVSESMKSIPQGSNTKYNNETLLFKIRNRLDEYLGNKIINMFNKFGITNIYAICKKTD